VPYDFRRPIQLSREHSRILQVGFDGFARQSTTVFTSALRTVCQVSLLSVEQCNYAEYVDSLLAPTYMTIFTADPIPGRGVLEMPVKAVMSCIDHILGGPGSTNQPLRNLSEIESSVVKGFTERLLAEMRYSLSNVLDFEPAIVGVEYSPLFAQLAAASDVVAVATFELRINDAPSRMTVCLPFAGLLPHLVAAAAPAPVSERERAKRAASADLLRTQFESVPVDVTIRFRTTRVSPDSLGDLGVGDVIRLSHPAAAPLEVTADDTTFAHATPGAKGPKLAALIVGTPKEIQ
jgi:flagellar motor switch protein FliM